MQPVLKVRETYRDTPQQRMLDLRPDGVDCIPMFGVTRYRQTITATRTHVHPGAVEITLCVRGNLVFEAEGVEYAFLPGRLFVSTARQPHRLKHNLKGMVLYRLLFRPAAANRRILGLTARESEWVSRSLAHLPKRLFQSNDRVRNAFRSLFALYDKERRGTLSRRVKMKAAALELLVSIIEAARFLPPRPPEKIAAIVRRIDRHPEADYPIAELSAEAGISAVTFAETFKRTTGLPPHAYLTSRRIVAAKRMLCAHRAMSVKAIANMLRFSTVQHFSNVFKNSVGISPVAYRLSGEK